MDRTGGDFPSMTPYSELASSYDYVLRHVDYQEWYGFIRSVLERFVPGTKNVVELGCGTGRFGAKFSNDGYSITGIDISHNMLLVAKTRAYAGFRIFRSDIREFALKIKPGFIFSVHDTMNYLTEPADLEKALVNVKSNMDEKTIFMFDMTTENNIKKNFDGKTMNFRTHSGRITWSNVYDRDRSLVLSTLRFKKKGEPEVIEEHIQRIYTTDEVLPLLEKTGFRVYDIFSDYTMEPPSEKTVMTNYVTGITR
jgi:SAM-dependent methyltransferase